MTLLTLQLQATMARLSVRQVCITARQADHSLDVDALALQETHK